MRPFYSLLSVQYLPCVLTHNSASKTVVFFSVTKQKKNEFNIYGTKVQRKQRKAAEISFSETRSPQVWSICVNDLFKRKVSDESCAAPAVQCHNSCRCFRILIVARTLRFMATATYGSEVKKIE